MYEKTRVLSDTNDEITVLVILDAISHAASAPQTIIEADTLKNAKPGFVDYRLTFKSITWGVDKNTSLVFLDSTAADSERIFIMPANTSGTFAGKIENDTADPVGGDIAYHTDNGNTHGYFCVTFIKERGYDFTGKRYRKVAQPNPYLTNS
jgi:hypothetical protein